MKNLSKRTKMLLAIAGIVIVAVVVGFVLVGGGEGDLYGSDVIHISPTSATINIAQSLNMSINSMFICKWSSSDSNIVVITIQDPSGTKQITVEGNSPGSATIKADCAIGNRYSTVTVRQPPVISPANPIVGVGKTVTLTTGNSTCTWSRGPSTYGTAEVSISPTTGASVVVTGVTAGHRRIDVDCSNGHGVTTVTVQ